MNKHWYDLEKPEVALARLIRSGDGPFPTIVVLGPTEIPTSCDTCLHPIKKGASFFRGKQFLTAHKIGVAYCFLSNGDEIPGDPHYRKPSPTYIWPLNVEGELILIAAQKRVAKLSMSKKA